MREGFQKCPLSRGFVDFAATVPVLNYRVAPCNGLHERVTMTNNNNNTPTAHRDTPAKWRVLKPGTGLTRRTGLALEGDMGTGTTYAKWNGGAVVTVSNRALVFVVSEGTITKAFAEHVASTWRKGATVSIEKTPAGTAVLVARPAKRVTK